MSDAPFICNIHVENKTAKHFVRADWHPDGLFDNDGHGSYETEPPESIGSKNSAKFILDKYSKKTTPVGYGPEGCCKYESGDSWFRLSYKCPTIDSNSADVDFSNDLRVVMTPNPLPETGHPMNVQFTVMEI